jgi:hypothetical protein
MANKDYGIKVSKVGADINSNDIRDLLMSSKFPMLKYHAVATPSVSINAGDTDKYVDVTHTLGYTPAFISYHVDSGNSYYIPTLGRGTGNPPFYTYSWADASKVRVGYALPGNPYGTNIFHPLAGNDYWDNHYGANSFILVGNKFSSGFDGAIRFPSINVTQGETIVSATLDVRAEYSNNGGGDVKFDMWGIAEDNTSDFSGSPMGRTKTSSVTHRQGPPSSTGQYFGVDVKNQVQEIVNRGGWSSGNSLGFTYGDTGSFTNSYMEDDFDGSGSSKLTIVTGSSITISFRVIIFKDKLV